VMLGGLDAAISVRRPELSEFSCVRGDLSLIRLAL
jgi:hypothetical protein